MSRPSSKLAPLLEEDADDLYEHAPCGYLSTLTDGTVVKVNETFLEWTGYERHELVDSRRIHELLAPGDRIFYETHFAPLIHMQGAVHEIAVEFLRADGSRLPALVNSVLRRDEGAGTAVIRTTIFDVTERRGYEKELVRARRDAEVRARASAALARVSDGVVVLDEDDRIVLTNGAARLILGIDEHAVGEPVREAIPGWHELHAGIPVGTLTSMPAPKTLPRRAGGREQWLTVAGVHSGDGIVYTFRDVTDERRLETMRDELISIVSHELRTPLAGVYGAAQTLLARASLDEEQRRRLLEMVVEQSERLRRLVDDILLSRRLDAGEVDFERGLFDLAAVVRETVREIGGDRGEDGRLQVDAEPPVPVHGDPQLVRQAIANLVENALKYAPHQTPVLVEALAAGAYALVRVRDQGPGIPPGQRERIFERFYRLAPEETSSMGGAGLGLYIARELIARMGGRVGVEPAEEGSTFFIELPLARASA